MRRERNWGLPWVWLKGRESAARANATEIASLKVTNKALNKNLGGILEQSNGVDTGKSLPLRQHWNGLLKIGS